MEFQPAPKPMHEFSRPSSRSWIVGFLALLALMGAACAGSAEPDTVAIGLVTNNPNGERNIEGFRAGLADLGYTEGENVEFLTAGEPVQGAELDAVLQSFVDAEVDLIFTAGTPTGVAAHRITEGTDIPVVFGVIADPISAGVLTDLDRPGGNMTGVKLGVDQARRLELLLDIDPTIRRVWIPHNPDDSAASSAVAAVEAVAADLGLELTISEIRTDADLDEVLRSDVEADALFLVPDSVVNARLDEVLSVAHGAGMVSSGPSTAQVDDGALMTYGFIHESAGRQAARIADQILSGADPATTPIIDTESFLAINMGTADELGVFVPDRVLRQAEIIRRPGDEDA